ncbi:spore germination protein KC [Fictibacillus halophilus]|uniref:Spore germination protein KC n=1 Tax=Fictibacillus halophilus TaxID=1610490 RepID=A0ABV2LIK2_9BACL|nr:Ger(x)C family spore germination protein [Fictibacillus halophilus]
MRSWKIFALIFSFTLILTGCAGRIELNELLIVSSIGVDYKKNKTIVHFQVVNPGGTAGGQGGAPSGGSGGSVYTYTVAGETLYDAVEKGRNILPRKLLFSHITSVIIGEKYARTKGLAPLFDFMERNHEVRDNVIMFVAKNSTAKDILSMYTPIFKNPGESLKNRVRLAATSTGISEGIKEKDVVRWRYGEFRDPVIQGVEIVKINDSQSETSNLENISANDKTYRISGLAVFKKEKMVTWLNNDQTRGWSIINRKVKDIFILSHKCDSKKGNVGFMVKSVDSKTKVHYKDGKLKYVVNVKGKAILQEVTCAVDVGDPKTLLEMEKRVNEELARHIKGTVKKAQDEKTDVFGFGKLLYNKDPEVWKKYKENWKDEFSNVELETNVSIKLESVGARVETIHEQK